MSDGAISQDEIDALLSGVSIDGLSASGHVGNGPAYNFDIKTLQKLADDLMPKLQENINKYTSSNFVVESPVVETADRDKVLAKLPEVVVGVVADYSDGVKGNHLYLLSPEFALKIYQLVSSEDVSEVDEMVLSSVAELVATHVSSQITQIDSVGKIAGLAYSTPEGINESKAMIMFPQGDFVLTSYPLVLDGNAYTLWECLGGEAAEPITKALNGEDDSDAVLTPVDLNAGMPNSMGGMNAGMQQPMMNMGATMQQPMMNMGAMQQPMMNMGAGMQMNQMQMPNMGMNMGANVPNIQQLQYPNLQSGMNPTEQGNIGLIMDVFMEMTVELGRCQKSIKEILGFGEGTIIELDKLAGEPVDILVNHKAIAKGEVVVIDENFGVRVTEILSPIERVNDLS